MSDVENLDDFDEPEMHPDEKQRITEDLASELLEFMMEKMDQFAELDPEKFATTMGHTAGFLIGYARAPQYFTSVGTVYREPYDRDIEEYKHSLIVGFLQGAEDASEAIEEQ